MGSVETPATTGGRTDRRSRAAGRGPWWALFLGLGALWAVLYFLLPDGGPAQGVVFTLAHLSLVGALAMGVWLHRPSHARIWLLILAGQVLYVIANVLWYPLPVAFGLEMGFPSSADALYLLAYALLLAGLLLLVRSRSDEGGGAVLLDTLVVTLGVGTLSWVLLMAHYLRDDSLPLLARLVSVGYPLVGLLLMGLLVALAFVPGHRGPTFWLLGAGLLTQLLTDNIYAVQTLAGEFAFGGPIFAGWFAFYALFGAAALHPSMRGLSAGVHATADSPAYWRLAVLAASALVPPVAILVQGLRATTDGIPVLAVVSAITFGLVIVRVGLLTRDVAERRRAAEQLSVSRDQAVEASRLKSEFLATMSHEIRTPLNAVIGLTGLLVDTDLDAEQQRYVTATRQAGEALLALINDILDFSRIEADQLVLEEVEVKPQELVEEVADLLGETARAKGVELFSYCHPEVPGRIRVDVGKTRQVLINLVGNAVKFTDAGEVAVRVSQVSPHMDEDGRVLLRFEVRDTGIGIAEMDRDRLFELFTQADSSTTRRHGGTGLGLAISRRLVEFLGGQIAMDSTPGQGSRFWFTMPVPVVEAHGPALPEHLTGMRLLVIDDNETNRLIVEQQTLAWGMRPSTVASGNAALRQLEEAAAAEDPYRLALLDLHMPEMDGLEVAARIRGDHRLAATAVVMLVSGANAADLQAAARAGVRQVLTKPVRQSHLYDAVMRTLMPSAHGTAPRAVRPDAPRGSARVLLVEDNPANQLVGTAMLEKLGCTVDVAADGAEALESLRARPYDVILMDCQMPRMDGFETTRRLRAREQGVTHTPVIALTASATAADRERCLAAGMDDYITKPISLSTLSGALEHWVAPRARRDAQPVPPPSHTAHDLEPALDAVGWTAVEEMAVSADGLLERLIMTFRSEALERLAALHHATTEGDLMAVEHQAHALRGSAITIGAVRLSEIAQRLEEQAAQGAAPDKTIVAQLGDELRRVDQALEDKRQGGRV